MVVKEIMSDTQFRDILNLNLTKLIVVDFYAIWCGPCKRVAPKYIELSNKYDRALFLEVDVDKCEETATSEGVSAMPTFILYRNKLQVAKIRGADIATVESKIIELYEAPRVAAVEDCGVPGQMDLSSFIVRSQCEALNDSDDHPLPGLFEKSGYIESDCDQQLILSFIFTKPVKVHSIKVKAPKHNGPKSLRLFTNHPNTIDFDSATFNLAAQELDLKPDDLDGKIVNLKYVKFQNVYNLQIFVVNNQTEEEVTRIDSLNIIGMPTSVTLMGDFKRIAGKVGESH
ncbi:thioredoxin-like protein 1 [Acyrthosiphon pisum]|uniref:Thioredoxin-like protein 1 n=1 Tax=Acyrthosiphon pisum TaxID=7029 RepID=A0A8R1VYJ9_ACYPI|nr:thioredoxin-like protein 1 [Acyrthosiphon pisum]|eukprot:XP_001943433.1 PREDICTED: thioredoxin-like protein 1 [Acyrthosiphon pisum]